MSGREGSALGRREFVRRAGMAGAAAGLIWSTPRIASAAPALAGTPMPTQTTGAAPPEVAPPVVAPLVIEPGVVEPTVSGATVRPVRRPDTPPSVRGLAFTGENIDTMTAAGAVSLGAGAFLHRAAKRREASEVGEEAATSWDEP